ncbi:metal-dependent hydrolase YbeY [Vibrio maritimus]|uniref:Metal-dependent hydrolase YbeY n=1 Tax=Vibrio maritimus TaxID=990268 RepID=A0A090SR26_9VIBR|nr:metal-dependent hydrolase YbeY [Vibrio maritimus]
MSIELDLQLAVESEQGLPSAEDFQRWLNKTIVPFQKEAELTIRIVDEQESHQSIMSTVVKISRRMYCHFHSRPLQASR